MENKLAISPKKIGKQIVAAAIEKHKTQQSDKVVNQIGTILERMNVLTLLQQKTDRQMQLCRNQMDAIQAGEFIIDQYTASIKFNDKDLNIPWDATGAW